MSECLPRTPKPLSKAHPFSMFCLLVSVASMSLHEPGHAREPVCSAYSELPPTLWFSGHETGPARLRLPQSPVRWGSFSAVQPADAATKAVGAGGSAEPRVSTLQGFSWTRCQEVGAFAW